MQDHLMMMYKLGGVDKNILDLTDWEHWYEITKFKDIFKPKKRTLLIKILKECDFLGSKSLRNRVNDLVNKSKKANS